MRAEYEAGDSRAVLAERYGCSETTVRNTLLRAGAWMRPCGAIDPHNRRDFTDGEVASMVERYRNGESANVIGASLEPPATREVVLRVLRPTGVVSRARGSRHPAWNGGRTRDPKGYVSVRVAEDHPYFAMARGSSNYIAEHRLVMAEHLGRALGADESVHHLNGVKDDNRIENLQLVQGHHGRGGVAICRSCGSRDIEWTELT